MDSAIPGKPAEVLPGPILLDGILQSFLLGTIVNQAFKYWVDRRSDGWRKRIFVLSVIILSILQTILEDYKVWRTLIQKKRWSTSPIEWSDLFLNGCICWLCEGFYIKRCWKMMEKNVWVLVPLSTLSVLIVGANIYLAIAMGMAFRSLTATDDTLTASHFLLPSTIVAFSFWIFGSLVLEVTVTALLLLCLRRSRTGFNEVDQTVVNIIHLTWESAILPSVCMIIAVEKALDDHLVLFFVLLTGKFYTFGMLRTLNSRGKLRQQMTHDLGRTSLTPWDPPASTSVKRRKLSTRLGIEQDLKVTQDTASEVTTPATMGPPPVFDHDFRFATSVEVNTPSLESQDCSTFRTRTHLSDQQYRQPFANLCGHGEIEEVRAAQLAWD